MSQDHRSPLPRPSHEGTGNDGATDRPAYPPAPPLRPPARWGSRRLSGGAAPEPGHGGPTPPAYGPPTSPLRGYGGAEAGDPGSGHPSPATRGGFGPPAAHRYGPPTTDGFTAPTAGGFGAPSQGGFAGPTGGPVAGGFGARTAGHLGGAGGAARFAPPEAPGRGGTARLSGLGAPAAPVRGAPAPARPPSGGYRAPDAARYAHAGPAPASWSPGDASEPTLDGYSNQAVHHQIRQAVVHRVQYANALHASHYWDLRRTSPVGPHALVFLYASLDPRFADPRRPYYEIKAASRLFRDGAEVQDLPALLAELCEIAEGYLAGGGVFDPVAQMTQAGEPMPAEARYVGVSVSTLLGSGGAGVEPPGAGGMGIAGRNLVVMSDDNLLVVERPARAHEQVEVHSTCPHFSGGGVEVRNWLPLTPEQQVDPAWRALRHLNRLVLAGQERKAAAVASTGGRRRR
ncbi:hypothetical protein [Micromonospora sp. MA102]|uniref:hypothetical protein n=1 Tax=Micromonospora sp. MA102 TaxID=2952755 RepID=UPI0021C71D32|nr:hypothetical protein [Micromonospora sp. MA102]